MHKNVGAQRDNWNHLLLTSINMMTLSAATMAAMVIASQASLMALKVSSTILYTAATAMLVVMNTLQSPTFPTCRRTAKRGQAIQAAS